MNKEEKCKIKELSKEHLKLMFKVSEGATIFGYTEAKLLREVERYDKNLITIISNMKELQKIVGNEKELFDNKNPKTGHLAYFGAILTEKGQEWLNKECNKRGIGFCWED